ncbi:uncharacterized protein TrAtP1_007541 [Trichoderma atroviride]|uniref:uncharacterized protein n=1 Tax=Hypocrea atroviridis TaxID=63577 RepID=UPI00332683ED|nr:hypothetical protein TrAtP1_007541 [Trichoderma atroviride]
MKHTQPSASGYVKCKAKDDHARSIRNSTKPYADYNNSTETSPTLYSSPFANHIIPLLSITNLAPGEYDINKVVWRDIKSSHTTNEDTQEQDNNGSRTLFIQFLSFLDTIISLTENQPTTAF